MRSVIRLCGHIRIRCPKAIYSEAGRRIAYRSRPVGEPATGTFGSCPGWITRASQAKHDGLYPVLHAGLQGVSVVLKQVPEVGGTT